MRKLLLLAIAVLGMSNAQAQHLEGLKTISIIQAPRFSESDGLNAKMFVMGQKDYVETSYVSAIGRIEVKGTPIEAGKFYILTIVDGNITDIKELGKRKEVTTVNEITPRGIVTL